MLNEEALVDKYGEVCKKTKAAHILGKSANTINAMLRHRNPVAHLKHLVERQLNARHKAEDAVLKYQHQHRCRSTQTCE